MNRRQCSTLHPHVIRRKRGKNITQFVAANLIFLLFFSFLSTSITQAYTLPFNRNSEGEKTTTIPSANSVLWSTNVPGLVRSLDLYTPPNYSIPQLIVTSDWQITSLNLTTGTVLWSLSAEERFTSQYPRLIGWSYSTEGSTLYDTNFDGVPELWVMAEAIDNISTVNNSVGKNLYNFDPYTDVVVYNYLFTYDLSTHTLIREKPLGNLGEIGISFGHFANCTNNLGMVVEWDNITTVGVYYTHLAVLDSQSLDIVWEAPSLLPYSSTAFYRYWVYDLNDDSYDELILSWDDKLARSYVAVYDGRTFEQLWNTTLPRLINEAENLSPDDTDFVDITNDGIPDLIFSGDSGGVCAVDGTNGTIIWSQLQYPYYGASPSVVIDIDHDGEPEVITSFLEYLVIFNALTGELEVSNDLPFLFLISDLHVGDLDKDGEYEIVAPSFFNSGLYIFNRTFDLIEKFTTPIPGKALLVDINGDGTLEIIVGMKLWDQSPVVAYFYAVRDNTVDGFSLSPVLIILISWCSINVLGAIIVFIRYHWKKLKH